MASYDFGGPRVFAGWEHIVYENPSIPLPAGYTTEGGYVIADPNNTAYEKGSKTLQAYWIGLKYPILPQLDLTGAFYGEKQNAYATGKEAGCSTTVSSACSGNLIAFSLSAVYHFTKRFDAYAGAMYSDVTNGLANGYLERQNLNPTIGVRYSF